MRPEAPALDDDAVVDLVGQPLHRFGEGRVLFKQCEQLRVEFFPVHRIRLRDRFVAVRLPRLG